MMIRSVCFSIAFVFVVIGGAVGQENGRAASDVLMQLDMWGNPTPRGGVTNNGPNAHSVW